jgi:hypothetical protein
MVFELSEWANTGQYFPLEAIVKSWGYAALVGGITGLIEKHGSGPVGGMLTGLATGVLYTGFTDDYKNFLYIIGASMIAGAFTGGCANSMK